MKIKTKLRLGLGLLFLMIMALSLVAARHIYVLEKETENILQDNYKTLDFARNMSLALDRLSMDPDAESNFEKNLQKQLQNETEPGEKEATDKIADHFASLKQDIKNQELPVFIRNDLAELTRLNMEAIQAKSDRALGTVQSAFMWIALGGTICFVIAFTLLVNLPGNVGNPIRELTESIRAIADKRYTERLHFPGDNEFGELAKSFNTMAEKLEEYDSSNLAQILTEKKRIDALINNMHEPVIGLDENKIVLFANDQAVRITGMEAADMIGKSATELAKYNDLLRTLIPASTGDGQNSHPDGPLKIYADNKESYFEKEVVDITIFPTAEKTPQHIGQVILLKNITPFKELDFAKTNFIATVSHELKTPISSIKMSVQLLENPHTGALNMDQQQLISGIKDDSNRLLKITGELLNMSQVETGNIQLNIQKSSPLAIVSYAVEAVKIPLEQKDIQLITDFAGNVSDVKADMEKTAWVLINFLTNAVRYSKDGSKIEIGILEEDRMVRFFVRDEGSGIDSRYNNKIFDRYFQVPGSSKTGTGLGLAISKEFIQAQGGTIGVTSEIGMGSIFYFELEKA
jgi:NtrC-family two-component system sensor histidine kinase KinB